MKWDGKIITIEHQEAEKALARKDFGQVLQATLSHTCFSPSLFSSLSFSSLSSVFSFFIIIIWCFGAVFMITDLFVQFSASHLIYLDSSHRMGVPGLDEQFIRTIDKHPLAQLLIQCFRMISEEIQPISMQKSKYCNECLTFLGVCTRSDLKCLLNKLIRSSFWCVSLPKSL